VTETLRSVGLLSSLGQDLGSIVGVDYIEMVCSKASPSSVSYYANQVVDASIRRSMRMSIALTSKDLEEDLPADEVLDKAEERLWEMRRAKSNKGVEMAELLEILDTTIDDYVSGKRKPAYIPKNPDFRRIVGHLEDQDYLILGARPGEGKSSFLRAEAFLTARGRTPVTIINMDNGDIDYPRYLVAFMTGINSKKLRMPTMMTEEERVQAKDAIKDLKSLPIRVVTMGNPSVEQVVAAMKKAYNDGAKTFFVDYVQQIQNPGLSTDPVQNISYTSSQLRGFNMKWKVPVLVASQFNRDITQRGNNSKPTLSDFKGSGSLEQDATVAMALRLIEMEQNQLAQFPENLVERNGRRVLAQDWDIRAVGVLLYVLKNRNGPVGESKPIKWDKATNTYTPLADD